MLSSEIRTLEGALAHLAIAPSGPDRAVRRASLLCSTKYLTALERQAIVQEAAGANDSRGIMGIMTGLTEFLFPAPAQRSAGAILAWWEARRLPYNLIVGGSGLVSLGTMALIASLPPGAHSLRDFFEVWRPVVVFGAMANLCYLFGPTIEIALHVLWGRTLLPPGPALFRMGLTFSVGLTLLPTLLLTLEWVVRVLGFII